MQHYFDQPGVLYDCLLFLSLCHEDREPAHTNGHTYFLEVKERLLQSGITVPDHLSPLVCRQGKQSSFLAAALFDEWEYSQCTFTKMERRIENLPLMKRKFVEFYFPDVKPDARQLIEYQTYPGVIGLLKQSSMAPSSQTEFLYILFHFNEAMREISGIISQVRYEIEKQHRQFSEQNVEKLKQIQLSPVDDKLRAISGLAPDEAPIRYSLSLLDEEKISSRLGEPDFFILGSRYDDVLDTKYQYCHVTPASFIRALRSDVKRIIFEALLVMRPMTAADMEIELHLSRNAVARNIKEMRESGVVTVERVEGLSYYYTLNKEYLGIVATQLEQLKYQRNDVSVVKGS